MILKVDELPALPEADRIMVRPQEPQEETETGRLVLPDVAKTQAHFGTIVAAGLKALDIMYDNGQEVGDTIWYGQFAGTWEEWDHLVKAGNKASCKHESWDYEPSLKTFRGKGWKCGGCGALRKQEPLLVMNIGDVLANVDKAARVRSGTMSIALRYTQDGKTCHIVQRASDAPLSLNTTHTNGATNVPS